jgi:hypothetical protein
MICPALRDQGGGAVRGVAGGDSRAVMVPLPPERKFKSPHRIEHGDDIRGRHVGHEVVDLLEDVATAGPPEIHLIANQSRGRLVTDRVAGRS